MHVQLLLHPENSAAPDGQTDTDVRFCESGILMEISASLILHHFPHEPERWTESTYTMSAETWNGFFDDEEDEENKEEESDNDDHTEEQREGAQTKFGRVSIRTDKAVGVSHGASSGKRKNTAGSEKKQRTKEKKNLRRKKKRNKH